MEETVIPINVSIQSLTVAGIVLIICATFYWILFEKAKKPGWAVLVPLYNIFVISKIAKIKVSWIVLAIIAVGTFFVILPKTFYAYVQTFLGMPFIATPEIENYMGVSSVTIIIMMIWLIMLALGLAKRFGQNIMFAFGLLFFSPIFIGIIAFNDKVKYIHEDE